MIDTRMEALSGRVRGRGTEQTGKRTQGHEKHRGDCGVGGKGGRREYKRDK